MNAKQSATLKGKKMCHTFTFWMLMCIRLSVPVCVWVFLALIHSSLVSGYECLTVQRACMKYLYSTWHSKTDRQTSIYTHAHHSKCIMFWIQCTISRFVCTAYLTGHFCRHLFLYILCLFNNFQCSSNDCYDEHLKHKYKT